MHDTAFRIGSLAIEIYGGPHSRVLEIGSYDVNGSLRQSAPAGAEYIGLDIEAGPGVDKVVEPGQPLPVEDDYFDLVIASSVFEHDPAFWMTLVEMCRKMKPGGHLYLSAPSNGPVHRYPEDVWRFYPDASRALEKWAVSQGQAIALVESFIAEREADNWNDFVAVFRKAGGRKKAPQRTIHDQVPCTNVLLGDAKEYLKPRAEPEDQVLLARAQAEAAQNEAARAAEAARCGELQQQLGVTTAALGEMVATHQQRGVELDQSHARIADLERDLVHRDNQLSEALQTMRYTSERATGLETEVDGLRAQLGESDSRLARLAADLQNAQARASKAEASVVERFAELTTVTRMLRQAQDDGAVAARNADWLGQINAVRSAFPARWALLPGFYRRRLEHRRYLRKGLFNAAQYCALYPDVAENGMDPLRHYILHGMGEGRVLPV